MQGLQWILLSCMAKSTSSEFFFLYIFSPQVLSFSHTDRNAVVVKKIFQFQTPSKIQTICCIFTIKTAFISCSAWKSQKSYPQSLLQSGDRGGGLASRRDKVILWELFSREHAGYQRCPSPPVPTIAVAMALLFPAACRDTHHASSDSHQFPCLPRSRDAAQYQARTSSLGPTVLYLAWAGFLVSLSSVLFPSCYVTAHYIGI